jgi:hypothetical protein
MIGLPFAAAERRDALIKLDLPTIVKMGAHPLVPSLTQSQTQMLRPQRYCNWRLRVRRSTERVEVVRRGRRPFHGKTRVRFL